jgi:hypothetical protein
MAPSLVNEYDQWEPEFLGDAEMTATQRKGKVLTAAFQVYLGLCAPERLSGEEREIPARLSSLPADCGPKMPAKTSGHDPYCTSIRG